MEQEEHKSAFQKIKDKNSAYLVLHNDEINTFDFVIDVLIDICDHTELQAEQCALITHHKGKCDIKKGPKTILKPMKDFLIEKGLSVTVEV